MSDRAEPDLGANAAAALIATALFTGRIVDGYYQALGREVPDGFGLLSTLFLVSSLYAWFWSYSHAHRIPWILDMGWLVFAAWMIVIPYYVYRTEGRRGLARVGLFCLTALASWATGWAVLIWTQLARGAN